LLTSGFLEIFGS